MTHPYNNPSPLAVADMLPPGIWSPAVPGSGQADYFFYHPSQPSAFAPHRTWSRNVWSPPTSTGGHQPPPYGFFNTSLPPAFQPQLPTQQQRNAMKWQPSWNTPSNTRNIGMQTATQPQQQQQQMFVHNHGQPSQTPCYAPLMSHRMPAARPFKFHPQFQQNARTYQSPPFGMGLAVAPAYAAAGAMFYDPPANPPPGFGYPHTNGAMQPPPPYRPFEYQQRYYTQAPVVDDKVVGAYAFQFHSRPAPPPEVDNSPWDHDVEYSQPFRLQENGPMGITAQKNAGFGVVGDGRERTTVGHPVQVEGLGPFPVDEYDSGSWDRYNNNAYDEHENTYARSRNARAPAPLPEPYVEYQLVPTNVNPVLPPPPIENSAVPLSSFAADLIWSFCCSAYEKRHFVQVPAKTTVYTPFGVIGQETATRRNSMSECASVLTSPASTAPGTPVDQNVMIPSGDIKAKTEDEPSVFPEDFVYSPTTDVKFKAFAKKILTQTLLTPTVLLLALSYVERVTTSQNYPKELESPYRLLVVALMTANKILDDNSYRSETFAMISTFTLSKLDSWEASFLKVLDFKLNLDRSEWACWVNQVIDKKRQSCEKDTRGDELLAEALEAAEKDASTKKAKKEHPFVGQLLFPIFDNPVEGEDLDDEEGPIKSPHRLKKRTTSDTKHTLSRFGEDLTNHIPRFISIPSIFQFMSLVPVWFHPGKQEKRGEKKDKRRVSNTITC
ncbi:hypothetical protein BT69DRAFT_1296528 [Atractiella rhizophila]|nr:hypothetical protein BT69DRAFT_1296528 [Atractiella rhizophila]